MSKFQNDYQNELTRVAKNLGLSTRGNVEDSIIQHCISRLDEWVKVHGCPKTLTDLLNLFATSLDIAFEEVHCDSDIGDLLKRIPPTQEPVMVYVSSQLDDETDGMLIKRSRCQPGDRSLLAVVNCRGKHEPRSYFTKWHEAVHSIFEGQQLRMAMRKIRAQRLEPDEVLVDRVAAELAFYPPIFQPVVEQEFSKAGKLTFGGIARVRDEIAPGASFTSTAKACLKYCPRPAWFLTCGMGQKRDLERKLLNKQASLLPLPEPQLRVREVSSSSSAKQNGINIFRNMRVPNQSTVSFAFDAAGTTIDGKELLETWETSSSGPVGNGEIEVEAFKRDDEVWALIRLA